MRYILPPDDGQCKHWKRPDVCVLCIRDAEYRRALGIGGGPLPKTLGTTSGRGRSARRASKPRLVTRAPDTSAPDASGGPR